MNPILRLTAASTTLLLLSSLALAQVVPVAQDKIVGGLEVEPADPEATRTVALLSMQRDSTNLSDAEGICTGTLIDEDTVLTAAHCVSRAKPEHLKVVFNLNVRRAQPSDFRRVTGYRASNFRIITPILIRNDIALIHFSGGLKPGYVTVPLLPREQKLQDGEKVTLAGYGLAAARAQSTIGPLRKVEIAIEKVMELRRQVQFDQREGRGACNGDSGGPGYVLRDGRIYVWGVTSYGTGSTCTGKGVYTNAAQYQAWIERTSELLRFQASRQ